MPDFAQSEALVPSVLHWYLHDSATSKKLPGKEKKNVDALETKSGKAEMRDREQSSELLMRGLFCYS